MPDIPNVVIGSNDPRSPPPMDMSPSTSEQADACIRRHVLAAMGFGLFPSAIVDVVALTAVEVQLIRGLARVYNVPVPQRLVAYKILLSVASGLGVAYFSAKMSAAARSLPLVGQVLYLSAFSLLSGAVVYAVGKVIQEQFESNGALLDMKSGKMRELFKAKLEEGKARVKLYLEEAHAAP